MRHVNIQSQRKRSPSSIHLQDEDIKSLSWSAMAVKAEAMAVVLKQPEVSLSGKDTGVELETNGQISCGFLWLSSTVGGVGEGP